MEKVAIPTLRVSDMVARMVNGSNINPKMAEQIARSTIKARKGLVNVLNNKLRSRIIPKSALEEILEQGSKNPSTKPWFKTWDGKRFLNNLEETDTHKLMVRRGYGK